MIRTWMADITPLIEEPVYEACYQSVPLHRQEKADRIRFRTDRALSIGAWFLLMQMQDLYHLGERPIFNLSHSGSYVLCSVADGESENIRVGCDIEAAKRVGPRLADRFFCEKEAAYVREGRTEEECSDRFLRIWVLKESFMKAVRLGMKLDTRHFETAFDPCGHPYLAAKPTEFPEHYYYREYSPEGVSAKIAVCSTSCRFDDLEIYQFQM